MCAGGKEMEKKYIPGYSGYIPGDKWKFGSRSSSEPPVARPRSNGVGAKNKVAIREQDEPAKQRPPTRQQRFQSWDRVRSAGHLERIATRPMDTGTQYPVHTTEMAVQADVDGAVGGMVEGAMVEEAPVRNEKEDADATRRGRSPSRTGQRPLDGRTINHQRPDVLFMHSDPFKGLNIGGNGVKKRGRYYDPKGGQNGHAGNGAIRSNGIPTIGYSGHIPGLKLSVGKPYGEALRALRGDGQNGRT